MRYHMPERRQAQFHKSHAQAIDTARRATAHPLRHTAQVARTYGPAWTYLPQGASLNMI